jgi:hypothetical protein
MNSWKDYWDAFDSLISKLKESGLEEIIFELKDAQKHVNGLTDGWFEFKIKMEKTIESSKTSLTAEQFKIANDLIETLNKSLNNRS